MNFGKLFCNKRTYFIIIASILPLLFTVSWVFKNTQLPGSDAATYLVAANHMYYSFHEGFWHGLLRAFLDRGWRPIFFPTLTVPFIFLAKGNLLLATRLTAIVSIFLSSVYVYLYARLVVTRYSAVIITSIICLSALVLNQAVEFFAEAFFFPCVIGAIYHLIQSEYFDNIKHAAVFAVLVSLAALLRPIEMLIHLLPVFLFYLFIGLHLKKFSKKNVLLLLEFSLLALSLVFLCAKLFPNNTIEDLQVKAALQHLIDLILALSISLSIGLGLYLGYQNRRGCSSKCVTQKQNDFVLLLAFVAIFFIILVWYLPFAYQTIGWIYRTSFGDIAVSTTRMASASMLNEINMQVAGEGNFLVYASLLLFIATLLLRPFIFKKDFYLILPVLYLMLVSILPILEVLFTVQDIIRKLSTAFPILLMAFLMIGLIKGPFYKVRIFSGLMILIIQFLGLSISVFAYEKVDKKINAQFGFISRLVVVQPNPHDVVLDFIHAQSKKLNFQNVGIEVHPNTVFPVDPFIMNVMIESLHEQLKSSYPYLSSYSSTSLPYLREKYQAVFLSDSAENMRVSQVATQKYAELYQNEKNPSIKAFYQLLLLYSQQKLERNGWKLGSCIELKSITNIKYRGCILISLKEIGAN